jgi:hypothetical protein
MSAGVTVDAGWVDRGTTWTSSPGTVDQWVPVVSESLTEDPTLTSSAVLGQVSQYQGEVTRLGVTGDLVTEYDYNYGHGLLKYALGAEAAGTYSTADEVPYFGLEIDKGVSRFRYSSCAVQRLTISGQSNGVVTVTYGLVAYEEARSATAFPAIRPAESAQERAVFEHLDLWLGNTADALTIGDRVGVTGFELTLENALAADQQDSASSFRVLPPARNGFRTGTLRLDFARYNANLETGGTHPLDQWRQSHTQLQARLHLSGLTGSLLIQCPIMHLSEGGNATVGGPEVIPETATFRLEGGVNANMSGDQLELVTT